LCISPSNALFAIAANTSVQHIPEPQSYDEAVKDPGWQMAMEKEITALLDNNT